MWFLPVDPQIRYTAIIAVYPQRQHPHVSILVPDIIELQLYLFNLKENHSNSLHTCANMHCESPPTALIGPGVKVQIEFYKRNQDRWGKTFQHHLLNCKNKAEAKRESICSCLFHSEKVCASLLFLFVQLSTTDFWKLHILPFIYLYPAFSFWYLPLQGTQCCSIIWLLQILIYESYCEKKFVVISKPCTICILLLFA